MDFVIIGKHSNHTATPSQTNWSLSREIPCQDCMACFDCNNSASPNCTARQRKLNKKKRRQAELVISAFFFCKEEIWYDFRWNYHILQLILTSIWSLFDLSVSWAFWIILRLSLNRSITFFTSCDSNSWRWPWRSMK